MAVTKIKPIKSTLSKALDYIQNPDKTDGKTLVSSFGCSYETADIEFEYTLSQARQKGNNLAFHLIQSFEPGEVDCEKAHAIGKQLADATTKGQHEYVLTTHIDKGHVHNHIIFCAVNFVDYHKYNTKLNCLEYHRDSEFNLGTEDFILLLAKEDEIVDGKLDTGKVKGFRVPAGTLVEVYASTLHYAPCHTDPARGFRVMVALPRGTNTGKPALPVRGGDDAYLWACNKWLLAHPDSAEAGQGAVQALTGENIDIASLL